MPEAVSKKLMSRAGSLLRRRSYSRGELAGKLLKLADPLEVEAVLDRLEEVDLLNDSKYAYNLAFYRLRECGWGPDRVRHALLARQVAADLVEAALDRILQEHGERPMLEGYLDRYCAKNGMPSDRKGIQRLLLHLQRRGFTHEVIHQTLRQRVEAKAWSSFESGD
jgi:SOS response regulatory protein OraA/RecX